MMPAMSPWMTEGTITCWKIKEGDAFASGDVLLQIVKQLFTTYGPVELKWLVCLQESEIATIDVEAHSPGILGKILVSFFFQGSLPEHKVTVYLATGWNYQRPSRTSYRTCRQGYVRTRSLTALIYSNTTFISYSFKS